MLTGKIEHCPLGNGKLLKFFKQKDSLFRILFQSSSFIALAIRVKLQDGNALRSVLQ